jgi:dienelactone hydrolase
MMSLTKSKLLALAAIIVALSPRLCAQDAKAGKLTVTIRSQPQNVYFYSAEGSRQSRKILFAPGDRGCQGFAITISQELAKAGYDTYCFDTRRYLESFTGHEVLSTAEIASDLNQVARWVEPERGKYILLMGWSEGAGLALAAAADAKNQAIFEGLAAIGIPLENILAWYWKDIGATLSKTLPHEPTFQSMEFMNKVSPLPLLVIASAADDYVTPEATRALFSAAREPKRLVVIEARDHKFSGNTDGFFRALREGLNWIEQQHP